MTIRKASDEGRLGTLMASLGQIVKAHPGKLVLVFVLLTATMVPPLMGMDTSTSMEDFAPESEFLDGAEVMRSEFEPSTSAMVIIESEHGSMSDREGLQVLTATEEAIYASEGLTPHLAPNSTAVVTLAGPVATYIAMASNGSLDMSSAPDGLLEQAVTNVLSDPSASMLVSEGGEGRYALVVVNLVPTGDQVEQESVEKDLELAVEDVLPDGYRMHSYLVFSEKMREDTVEGLGLLMPLALLLVVAVLWFALRSVRDVVISILGVVTILIISLGIYSLTGMGFSQLLFFGPILILVLSIDFAIHILYRYNEIRRQGDLPVAAMGRSIGLVGVAVLVSALTTAVAFGSNGLSAIPAVAGFGVFLGIGISVSFIVMTLFVPSMKLLVEARRPTTPRPARRSRRTGGSRLVRATTMYPKGVVVVAVLLFAGSLAVAGDISNDMSSRDALSPDSEVVQAIDILEAEFPVTGAPRAFVLVTGDVTDPRNMVALDEFIFRAGAIPQVARIDGEPSIGSILPLLRVVTLTADNGTGTLDGDGDGIPDTREGMGSVLWSLWSDGVEGLAGPGEIRRILSVDDAGTSFDGVLVAIETADRDVGDTGVFLEHLRDEIRPLERREGLSVQLAGAEFEGYQMSTGMTDGMMRSTLVTVLVCTLIVILLMRSVKLGLITALPIVLTTGWILGLMYVLGYSLNMVTASITAMTVGVGMDFSIHIMERYREERRSGRLVRPAIERTLSTTGVSLVVAASTTLFGFLVIGTSDIAMFRTFGILSAMMIVLSMVSAMVVLPAKIVLLERDGPISRGSKLEEGGEPFVRAVDPDGRVPSVPVTAEVYSRAVKTN